MAENASVAAISAIISRFSSPTAPKKARTADIDKQHDREFAFFLEHLDVRLVVARRNVPVNVAYVVAILIFAHFREHHSPPFEGGMIFSGEDVLRQPAGFYFNSSDFFRSSLASMYGCCISWVFVEAPCYQGTSTLSRISEMISSAVMLLASAS